MSEITMSQLRALRDPIAIYLWIDDILNGRATLINDQGDDLIQRTEACTPPNEKVIRGVG